MTTATAQLPKSTKPVSLVTRWKRSTWIPRVLFPVAVLLFWQVGMQIIRRIWPFAVDVLPTPLEVVDVMWGEIINPFVEGKQAITRENLYLTFGRSLLRLGSGFAIAMVIGTIIGLGMGLSKAVDAFFHDWVMALLAMPALAWALFTGLIFGMGNRGPIVTVVLTGIPFVIVNVREGVRNTPRELFDMANAFKVPRNRATRHVLIPSLMPFFFAAIRYAFSIGWKGLVIAEVFSGQDGAGWTIKFYYDAHQAHGIIGYAFFFVIFALLLEKLIFEKISNRVFKWRPKASDVALVEAFFDGPDDAASATAAAQI